MLEVESTRPSDLLDLGWADREGQDVSWQL